MREVPRDPQPLPPPSALVPTLLLLQVGFNMRKVTRGAVTIKLWDLGGQVRPRIPLLNPVFAPARDAE